MWDRLSLPFKQASAKEIEEPHPRGERGTGGSTPFTKFLLVSFDRLAALLEVPLRESDLFERCFSCV